MTPDGFWSIVRGAFGQASPRVRGLVWQLAAMWTGMLALQIWDSRNAAGAAGLAELMSAVSGISGVGLLGLAHSLHLVMREAADRPSGAGDRHDAQRVLLALPTLGFGAGALLGAAALLMIVRGALGTPWLFAAAGAGFYAALTLFAGLVVTGSTSTLFALAARQAAANAELRDAVSAARLEALHARLNPHMLFNALNTVAALVRSDPRAAERVVENLGDVLRAGLDRSAAAQTSLGDEIAYVGACLNIERERWGESLRVRWDVPDDLRNVTVPTFVLQPLVENALKHGVGRRLGGGEIAISARADRDALTLAVEDDGPGFGPAWRDGVGLGNLRQRLRALYGGAAALTIEPHASGGHVRVRVPRG